jgi:hypothetical protein
MTDFTSDWPEDADGDVFRRLRDHGFDFIRRYAIDYNVDFDAWPPSAEAIEWLEREFGHVSLYPPEDDFGVTLSSRCSGWSPTRALPRSSTMCRRQWVHSVVFASRGA